MRPEQAVRYRKILHLDLDAFFCAVEEIFDPGLKGKPFAVGGSPDTRGVVSSCSYAARQFGVRSAMPMAQALQKCPGLIIAHSHYKEYSRYSKKTMDILKTLTPKFEQLSIDEAFLDVTDLPQSGYDIAYDLQESIYQELNLPCSLGVASNKLVAKIANNIGKARKRGAVAPRAIEVVMPGQEEAYLAPLKVSELWGIGPKSAAKLEQIGIRTIGELANAPAQVLRRHFGQYADSLVRRAKGIDTREVESSHDTKSISQEVTFSKDISQKDKLEHELLKMAENVGRRLREQNFCASTVKIKLRWPDFTTITRQVTLQQGVDQDRVIYEAALGLFHQNWHPGKAVRLLGVGASGLKQHAYQPGLWDTPSDKERRLLTAIDDLREKFGKDAVQRGVYLGKKENKRE